MIHRPRPRTAGIALILAVGASLGAATMLLGSPTEAIDTSKLSPTFVEEFANKSLDRRRWTQGEPGDRLEERTMKDNGERQIYLSPGWLGLDTQPVSVGNGMLTITARPLAADERNGVAAAAAMLPPQDRSPAFANLGYASGRVTTRGKFAQRYGYFEVRARFSPGQGLWPALWLLPANNSWPPEIDIMEALGHNPNQVITTIHSAATAKQDKVTTLAASDDGFHRYGVMWGPETIDSYIDGVKTASFCTPADAHQPMYFIANLAVGGNWPGPPDATTRFPATLDIDYVRAWKWPGPARDR